MVGRLGEASSTSSRVVAWGGTGGYMYELLSDGRIHIVQSPSGSSGGYLSPGTSAWQAIADEFEKLNPTSPYISRFRSLSTVTTTGSVPSTPAPVPDLPVPAPKEDDTLLIAGGVALVALLAGILIVRSRS